MDGFGRIVQLEKGSGATSTAPDSVVATEYAPCACTPLGKTSRVSQPYRAGNAVNWTTYTYDGLGRTVSVTLPGGSGSTTYAYAGNAVTVTSPSGKWKKYTRDAMGQLIQVEEPRPGGGTYLTSYTYDALGHLLTASLGRDGVTQTRSWSYDGATQRLLSTTTPEAGTTSFQYNADGTLYQKTDAKGQRTQYAYDNFRRPTEIKKLAAGSGSEDPCQHTAFAWDRQTISDVSYGNFWFWGRLM